MHSFAMHSGFIPTFLDLTLFPIERVTFGFEGDHSIIPSGNRGQEWSRITEQFRHFIYETLFIYSSLSSIQFRGRYSDIIQYLYLYHSVFIHLSDIYLYLYLDIIHGFSPS